MFIVEILFENKVIRLVFYTFLMISAVYVRFRMIFRPVWFVRTEGLIIRIRGFLDAIFVLHLLISFISVGRCICQLAIVTSLLCT